MEATVIFAAIGAALGAATAALWWAGDTMMQVQTITDPRAAACIVIGAILAPMAWLVAVIIMDR